MQLKDLAKGLAHPRAAVRLKTAQTIGVLDEVALLPHIAQAYKNEPEASVKQGLQWAGQRLNAARADGYSTMDEMFRYFDITRAINAMPTTEELKFLRRLNEETPAPIPELMAEYRRSLDELVYQRPHALTSADISQQVAALSADDSRTRSLAMAALFERKNMAALPHLVTVFLDDPDPMLREQAQNTAKYMYWNAISWRMHQDGTILAEIEKRAKEAGKIGDESDQSNDKTQQQVDMDAGEILRRAQEARAQRLKRKRRRG